jgi:hypothetical protein
MANAIAVVTNCVSKELARPAPKGVPDDKTGAINDYDKSLACVFKSSQEELVGQDLSAWVNHQDQFLGHRLIDETKHLWLANITDSTAGGRQYTCEHQGANKSFPNH